VYDPDLDDNLSKKFEDLGIGDASFLTVIDDEEENPRVNLQFVISSKVLPEDEKPVVLVTKPDIARKPRKPAAETNGEAFSIMNPITNGTSTAKRKRTSDEADLDGDTPVKKVQAAVSVIEADDAIILDDKGDGAIVIDDD
jgi:ubiquitin-like 1-activating enzyme E1 B